MAAFIDVSPSWPSAAGSFLAGVAALLIVCALIRKKLPERQGKGRPTRLPPGPFALPFIGNLHLFFTKVPAHRFVRDLSRKYGPIVQLRLGHKRTVVVCSTELAKEVLLTQDKLLANRPPMHFNDLLFYGQNTDIIFSTQSLPWRRGRKICTVGLFTSKRLRELEHVRREELAGFLERLQEDSKKGTRPVNFGQSVSLMLSHLILRLIQSEATTQSGENLSELLKEIEHEVSIPMLAEILPVLSWLDFPRRQRLQHLHDRLDAVLSGILARRKQQSANSYDDLVQRLLSKEVTGDLSSNDYGAEDKLTLNDMKAILLDMVGGGIHTTSLTLEWAMAELLGRPECLQRLQREADETAARGELISDADVTRMSYLKCVVKEVLRLHPAVPMLLPRFSTQGCELSQGIFVPANTTVLVNVWAIGRDKRVWGANADEFRPERFEAEDMAEVDVRGQHYQLLPFGSGRRLCLGLSMALSVLEVTLANLVHRFDWHLPPGEKVNLDEQSGLTGNKAAPTLAIPTPRQPLTNL